MQSEQLNIDGRSIEFRFVQPGVAQPRVPSSIDLVMLHEGLGSVSTWRDFPEQLAAATGCRTLVYSRLGYGRSSALEVPRRVDYMHEEANVWLPAILERLHVKRPVLFGHSDGASIALIRAANPESDLSGIIALAPHVKVEDLTVRSIEAAKAAYLETDLRVRLGRHHADVDSAFWGWNRIWLDPAFRSWNIESLLPSIRSPILVIQGEDDEYGTAEQVASIARALPNSQSQLLPACRHSPHRDQPQAVLAAARHFIARLPHSAARLETHAKTD
jgi:pimeloyl-ACP methyl ester carboxylesterase